MKLNSKDFKRFKELEAKIKDKKATTAEQAEFAELQAKRNERGSNSIDWWKNYPALLEGATNLPFNWIPGTSVSITGYQGATDSLQLGVMAVAILRPSIGISKTNADAFNAQIRQLWLDLHRKYRGIGTYEKSDLGIAILAINSLFETLAKFERIYGVINTYHIGNRVVPAGLKEMLSISDDLEENLADFRYQLNLVISKVRQLCLPKGLSVLMSDIVSLSNLFKDSEDRRAFIFGFDTDLFGVYDPTTLSTGGCVKYENFVTYKTGVTPQGYAAFTLSDIVTVLNKQLSALLNDDDIARICSDLLAAYGENNVMTVSELPEMYTVEPVHDYERLIQFHNLTLCGEVASIYEDSVVDNTTATGFMTNKTPIVIYQNNNTVMSRLGITDDNSAYVTVAGVNYPQRDINYYSYAGYPKEYDIILDFWVEQPGEVEIMCGSRYTTVCDAPVLVSTNHWRQEVNSCGTKVATSIIVYRAVGGGLFTNAVINGSVISDAYFKLHYYDFMQMLQMDWHPIFYISSANIEVFGDVDNFTVVNAPNLSRLHDVALLSGYKIPMVSIADNK